MTTLTIQQQTSSQYSLTKIIGIWLAVTLPMAILGWIISPDKVAESPFNASMIRVVLITIGLIWQFIFSLIIVYFEEGNLQWDTICARLRLNSPRDPQTGEVRRKLWLWLMPFVLLYLLQIFVVSGILLDVWTTIFPFLSEPETYSMAVLFDPAVKSRLVGAWWFFALFTTLSIFNMLGEGFLFHGILLPKMNGVFGKWDWLANGALFALYHVHQPWGMLGNFVSISLLLSLPAKYFRSTTMAILIHATQTVIVVGMLIALMFGLV